MRIALASARIIDRDIDYNLSQMQDNMRNAKAKGADLICFGEAFLQGFNALSWQYEKDRKIAIATSSQIFLQIKTLVKEIGIDVLFGYNELENDTIYSSCALIERGEIAYNYRRISKGWKEDAQTDEHYKEGTTVKVFNYKEKKCVIALCGDLWEYPEKFALDEDILFWPVYVSWTKEEWENGGKHEYAEQAKLCCKHTFYINSISDGDAFGGAVQFFLGNIEKELPIYNEGLLLIDI